MPTDVRTQLRDLGDELRRSSDAITMAEITGSLDEMPAGMRISRPRIPGRTLTQVAAIIGAAAAVVGLVVIADRPGSDPVANPPLEAVLPEPMAPAGSLVLGTEVPGWQLRSASDGRSNTNSGGLVRRIYATASARPEEGPALIVKSFDTDAYSPDLDAATGTISVQGVDGFLLDRAPGGRGLAFELNGVWYDLTAYNLTDDQLIAAAEVVEPAVDGYGAIINPTGLPAELIDEVAGAQDESWFLSRSALDNPIPYARWENGPASIWLQSLQQDQSLDRFQRIGAATVTDTTMNGHPAFLRTLPGQDRYRSLTWHADGRTHMLGSVDVSQDDLIRFAETLRPATLTEWNAVQAAVARPTACVGADCTGQREPGSIVPSLFDSYPAIDDALVPDAGRGTTFATYNYFPEYKGPIWTGVIGAPDTNVYNNLITVTVSAAGDAERVPVEPGRSPDVGEYEYNGGAQLVKTTSDGAVVVVQGRDIDQLYNVLDHIAPTTTDGNLSGYTITGELPAGLSELETPVKRSFDDGSFPWLNVNGGVLTMGVFAGPALTNISGWIGPIEQLTIADRPALLSLDTSNNWAILAIQLDDGNTLTLTGDGFERQELINLANSVEFLDKQAWTNRYGAVPAVIPITLEDTPATTIVVDQGE